jgi:hypothetical protein
VGGLEESERLLSGACEAFEPADTLTGEEPFGILVPKTSHRHAGIPH